MIERVYDLIGTVRREYAPDPRLSIFEIDAYDAADVLVLYGAVSEPAAIEALHSAIAGLDLGRPVRDEIERLPRSDDGHPIHAVVRTAVAPMLAGPIIAESHLSQLVVGSRVLVLREHGRWLQCRSVDGYIGWIHRGYVQRMTEVEARDWEMGADSRLHVSFGAQLVDGEGAVIARLPWGGRFHAEGGIGFLPDGLRGTLRGACLPAAKLRTRFPPNGASIVSTALEWTGAPYVWGGVTPAGVDCSGLVQAVLRVHGIELPRDSDQQERVGEPIELDAELENLRTGDLLYFAEHDDRVSHVAISMGGGRIVHSALGNGGVRTNDLDGATGYERELRSLLRSARRVIRLES